MTKIRLKNVQTAQGMVEFALVLPILLLLILGIFAFGHLFFTYSSLVSASREAARWGAAVGGEPGQAPRFSDCDSIRATAVRIGAFAGVNMSDIEAGNDADTGIEITYDKGPNTPLYPDGCPLNGPGPEDVELGDRIRVRVKIMYQPPVPVVNLPSFPLEATTFRTILKSVPVGEVPTAVDPCIVGTDTTIWAEPSVSSVGSETPSVVGQAVTWHVQISRQTFSTNPEPFVGDILIYNVADNTEICKSTGDNPLSTSGKFSCTVEGTKYPVAETIHAKAQYIPSGSCFQASENTTDHVVNPAETSIIIDQVTPTLVVNQSMTFNVMVNAIAPGVSVPTGTISFKFGPFAPGDYALGPDGSGNAITIPSITIPPSGISAGTYNLTASYPGNASLLPSTTSITVTIISATPTVGPTLTRTPTKVVVVATPTNTVVPNYCPRLEPSSYDIFQIGNALQFPILNPNVSGASNTDVKSVEIWWPGDPTAQLQEIRFGTNVDSCLKTGGNKNCLFQTTALDPTHQLVTSSTPGWDNQFAGLNKNNTKFMRLFFNHSMPQGSYHLRISFSNSCVLDFSRDKVTP